MKRTSLPLQRRTFFLTLTTARRATIDVRSIARAPMTHLRLGIASNSMPVCYRRT